MCTMMNPRAVGGGNCGIDRSVTFEMNSSFGCQKWQADRILIKKTSQCVQYVFTYRIGNFAFLEFEILS